RRVSPSRARSACRTAQPSTAELSKAGRSTRAVTSRASTLPTALCTGTSSTSATGLMRSPISASASSTDISGPPKAKQSSLSWAMRGKPLHQSLHRLGMGDDDVGDRDDVVDVDHRAPGVGQRDVARHGDDAPVLGIKRRLAVGLAVDLQLHVILALEAL